MWDAQQNYWYGHEWDKADSWQPTGINYSDTRFATSPSDIRYFNTNYLGTNIRYDAQTALFRTLPNANELAWYCMEGDPRWDDAELWTTMKRLYKGGMWFKKKANIPNFSAEHIPGNNSIDARVITKVFSNTTLQSGIPSPTAINEYFYLPAIGEYIGGTYSSVGIHCDLWSVSADPEYASAAYSIGFKKNAVGVSTNSREYGYRVRAFE